MKPCFCSVASLLFPPEGKDWSVDVEQVGALYRAVRAQLDECRPGYGPDRLDPEPLDWPSAWAHFASAEAIRAQALDDDASRAAAIHACSWLDRNSDLDGDGQPGYGVPIARRLFGGPAAVPANLAHSVPTAEAVRALLDTYEATGDSVLLERATGLVEAYVPYRNDRELTSCFKYVRSHDLSFEVMNANALLAAQTFKVAVLRNDAVLHELSERAYMHLFVHAQGSLDCPTWSYHGDVRPDPLRPKRPNDLLHEAYIIRSIIDYLALGGRHAQNLRPRGLLTSLTRFLASDGVREMPIDFTGPRQQRDLQVLERPARLGGVASALEAAVLLEERLGSGTFISDRLLSELEIRVDEDSWMAFPRHATAALRALATVVLVASRAGA